MIFVKFCNRWIQNLVEEVYIFRFSRKCTFIPPLGKILQNCASSSVNNAPIIFKSKFKYFYFFWRMKTNIMPLFSLFKEKFNKYIYKYGTTFLLISHNVIFIELLKFIQDIHHPVVVSACDVRITNFTIQWNCITTIQMSAEHNE